VSSERVPLPLVTAAVVEQIRRAMQAQEKSVECSFDLGRSRQRVELSDTGWCLAGQAFPLPTRCKERTIYHWEGAAFEPVARYTNALYKLVPTPYGPPTFEIDGIKMLPSAERSPYDDAEHKVRLIAPQGRRILDTCGGLGYFAAWCLELGAGEVLSFEKNPEVLWLRSLNPWSPQQRPGLHLTVGDIAATIQSLPSAAFDAVLHDPPRFGIAGELYAGDFYAQLARVLKPGGRLFHYTGHPNRLTSGREVASEVAKRLQKAGFSTAIKGDGILASKR